MALVHKWIKSFNQHIEQVFCLPKNPVCLIILSAHFCLRHLKFYEFAATSFTETIS